MNDIGSRLNYESNRDATASIRGYDWQRWLSLETWLDLNEGETLWLEIGEDFAVEKPNEIIAAQAKNVNGGISLNTQTAKDFINTAYSTNADVKYYYISTQTITKEQDNRNELSGIELWNNAATDEKACTDLAKYLKSKSGLSAEIRDLFKTTDANEIRKVLSKIKWLVGQEKFDDVKERVIRKTTTLVVSLFGENSHTLGR